MKTTTSIESLEPRIAPATITVTSLADDGGGDLLTLREAIDLANATPDTADLIIFGGAAAAGGVIELMTELDITSSLTIKGPGAGKVILDGNNASRIFNIDDGAATVRSVAISGLSLVDGNAVGSHGGGIFSAESLTLSKVTISSCVAAGDGGGVFAETPGRVVIKASLIQGNFAGANGGGISLQADGGVQITASNIAGNTAQQLGGGVHARIGTTGTGDILIDASKLVGNTAGTGGGGAFLANARQAGGVDVGKMMVRASLIANNTATGGPGGGLEFFDGFASVVKSQLSNNTASEGGGIFAAGSDLLSLSGSTLSGNRATGAGLEGGGGLQADTVTRTVIQSSVFAGNTSASDGGGFAIGAGTALVRNSTFAGNVTAFDGGGGTDFSNAVLTVESSRFLDNRAGSRGGGLDHQGTQLTVKSSLFQGNYANRGGGMGVAGDAAILGSRLIGNYAVFDGGGAYVDNAAGTSVVIKGGLVSENVATFTGGGLRLDSSGSKSILGTVVRDNVAYDATNGHGGGIDLVAGTLTLSKTTTVINNAAAVRGGGIANDSNKPVALNGAKVVFNTAATDAQIFGLFTT